MVYVQQYCNLAAAVFLTILAPLPRTNATAESHIIREDIPSQCSIEPVSRVCCGPNATVIGNYCACKQYHGCERPCEPLRSCPTSVGFHINVPRRCDLRVKGAAVSGPHGSAASSPEQCIAENRRIRFVHIDKSGGTAVRAWWEKFYPEKEFANRFIYPTRAGHNFVFGNGCVDDCYMFFARDPVGRWLSRFAMRERDFAQDPVRYERVRDALAAYPTPNHLAEALSSSDPEKAKHAWKTFHTSDIGVPKKLSEHYLARLSDQRREQFLKRLVFVGATSSLADDFMAYVVKVGLPLRGSTHFQKLNAMPQEQSKELQLSSLGLKNVEKELAQEYTLLNTLHTAGYITPTCTSHATCDL